MDSALIQALEIVQMLENGAEAEVADGEDQTTTEDGVCRSSNNHLQIMEDGGNQHSQHSQHSRATMEAGAKAAAAEAGANNQLSPRILDGVKEVEVEMEVGASSQQTATQVGTSLSNLLNSTVGAAKTTIKEDGAETAEVDGDLSLIILSIDKY